MPGSPYGPWTRPTLDAIAARPGTRAGDLAAAFGRELAPFKLDVRKLKNLGPHDQSLDGLPVVAAGSRTCAAKDG